MKARSRGVVFVISLILPLWQSTALIARADPGLLIIAHGSPSKQWNEPVLEFGRKVAAEAKKKGRFKAVRTAMLEATEPRVPDAVAELEAEGCDRIVAVPLFVAPSGHSLFDVPAVLGLYSSPDARALIAEEGGRIARAKVPITLTQTLGGGDMLGTFALEQVRKLSKNPADEALVLIAHGDENHQGLLDGLMRRAATHCCGQARIDYADWAFVEMGQGYLKHGLSAIAEAAKHKKRVLVIGLYVSSSALRVHQSAMARQRSSGVAELFDKSEVVFSEQGIITSPSAVRWVLDAAGGALNPLPK